jgi:2-succinyl-5-enolpyruvyl-6-hydroxy-3-cyclohexene-1-carboxylate synthase
VNDSAVLARLAVEALTAAGVGHVVLCPGSRSAPLAYALAEPAGTDSPAPALHVRHDERVAAFTALGVARGALAVGAALAGAVVTTSGTAAANLHPAVLEAHHAGVPLVVVTADRPPALRGTWANQTSELQADLFGGAVRARLDLADDVAAADPAAARVALLEALAAMWGTPDGTVRPGPVHLDLGFTDPLVPDEDEAPVPPATDVVVPRGHNLGTRGELVEPGGRTVVVAGDGAGWEARWLAEAGGWPLLAEPTSGARSGPNAIGPYRLLLELPELGGAVERVLVLGRPTLSRPVTRLLSRADVEVVLVSPYTDWPDPGRPVRRIVGLAAPSDLDGPKGWSRRPADDWLTAWVAAGEAAQRALDGVLDDVAAGWAGAGSRLSLGPLVAREVAAALQAGDLLVAAASNPIRDLDLAGRPFDVPVGDGPLFPGDHTRVVANRGLAGIDGTLSTAVGAGLARAGSFVQVLVGDLAFLHDVNGLLAGPGELRPDLQVVVLDDDGGGIFGLLEHGARAAGSPARDAVFERVFGTPHGADVESLCRGYGVTYRRADGIAQLRAALAEPAPGTSVVHVRSPRAGLRELHARIRAEVHASARAVLQQAVSAG